MIKKITCFGTIFLFLLITFTSIPANAYVTGVGVDSSDDVIVSFSDYILKLNGENGEIIWVSPYSGDGVLVDNKDDNFVATGSSNKKFSFKKFDGETGDILISNKFQKDYKYVMKNSNAIDSSDDVIITGPVFDDPFNSPHFRWTVKIDGQTGEIVKEIIIKEGLGTDAYVLVDSNDNIIIFKENGKFIKYNNDLEELSTGQVDLYDGLVWTITLDSNDNFVVGIYTSLYADTNANKTLTMKYDSDGNDIWDEPVLFDSGYDRDKPHDITVDKQNNVIVMVQSEDGTSFVNSFLLKYDREDGSKILIKELDSKCCYVDTDSQDNIIAAGSNTKKFSSDGTLLWTSSKPDKFPPKKPQVPKGPEYGDIGKEYTFKTSTTDIDSDQLYYMFDWGDGNMSDWLGPFGWIDTPKASHAWDRNGTYEVRVKAKDNTDLESDYSDSLSVKISEHGEEKLNLSLSILKGFHIGRIFAEIDNKENTTFSNLECKITVEGGLLGMVNINKEETINVPSNTSITVTSYTLVTRIVRRFGIIDINVELSKDYKSASASAKGFVVGRFVLIF